MLEFMEALLACMLGQRLERQVRVDRARAVADQQREVVGLARLAGLEDEARPACAFARGRGGCAGRRRPAAPGSARSPSSTPRSERMRIVAPLVDRLVGAPRRGRPAPARAPAGRRLAGKSIGRTRRLEGRPSVSGLELRQLLVVEERRLACSIMVAALGLRVEQVALRADDASSPRSRSPRGSRRAAGS